MMRRVPLRFWKYHGLGNDFVLVEGPLMDAARARRVCDRHRGVGADGVVTILPPRTGGAAAEMHIYNAVRCLARHLAETRGLDGRIRIDTGAGTKECTLHRGPGGAIEVSVEMGPARLEGEQDFTVAGEAVHAVRVSMGNPHAVVFDPAPSRERAGALGPPIERAVPGGVNVGFARPGPRGIDLVVWERGAGLTDACGTGACAAAAAAVTRGDVRPGEPVEVRLPGGALTLTVSADLARVTMRGPAERVFAGEADL
jgi:diaminopimelate epimerase